MNLERLEIFIAVADLGSFAAVARQRDIDPSSVSRQIQTLEKDLNFQFFKRTTRNLQLTQFGSDYLHKIKPALEAIVYAGQQVRENNSQPHGQVSLSTSVAFGHQVLLPLTEKFYQRYPAIQLRFHLSDTMVDLQRDNIDLAIRLSPNFDSRLHGFKLFNADYHLYASPNYLVNNKTINKPSDIGSHRCVTFDLNQYRSRWLFKSAGNNIETIPIKPQLLISNALALKKSLVLGHGIGLLADWLAKDAVEAGHLERVLKDYRLSATDFSSAAWLLYPNKQYLATKIRVFIDFLKQELQQKHSSL